MAYVPNTNNNQPGGSVSIVNTISPPAVTGNVTGTFNDPLGMALFHNTITSIQPGNGTSQNILKVYPNPLLSPGLLHVNMQLHNAAITLYNSQGQKVVSLNNLKGKTIEINKENLNTGFYYYLLLDNNKIFCGKYCRQWSFVNLFRKRIWCADN